MLSFTNVKRSVKHAIQYPCGFVKHVKQNPASRAQACAMKRFSRTLFSFSPIREQHQ